ncbi:MAG: ABC transporter substrate-binding protein [Acidimicrobiales bacterium]
MRKPRLRLSTAVTTALVVVLAACGGGDTIGDESDGAESSGERAGGTVTVALSSDILTMDPAMHRSRITQAVIRNVFDALVNQDQDLAIVPELAESWESTDEVTWIFHLREGVTFHNGEELDADAVKFSLDRIVDPATASPRASMLSMIESVEVVDPLTVRIVTDAPSPTLLPSLAVNEIVPPDYFAEVGPEGFAAAPIGTGAFTFDEWVPNERVALAANADYWNGGPNVDQVVFRPIPEVAARVAELQAGAVDIVAEIPPDLAESLGAGVEAAPIDGTRSFFLAMNVTIPPFDDRDVRVAANQAVDKEALVDDLLLGFARPLDQPLFPEVFGYVVDFAGYEYDPDAASQVFEGVTGSVQVDVREADRLLAEAVAGQLREAGLDVSVNVLETQAFTERIGGGQAQAYIDSWGVAEGDADVIFARHFWSENRTGAYFTGFSDPTVDQLVVDGRTTADPDERRRIYAEATEMVMEAAPWVPLYNPQEIYGVSAAVEGFEPSPIGRFVLAGVRVNGG